ncbi:hypothetical protein [Duganella sp. Root1480D1]|uniref:hypothetical protein n=1 Tax=Duganella sp. Root1480D1 TaxID=1736471 RepID=UPI00071111BD|nr:hypothetical protein [Duganella sp. Root1480D1]KQZ28071.1 hypothetical protein ASD58_11535 [Duganella sp. Root1480D1]
MLKASDLRATFGNVSQNRQLYLHSDLARNIRKRTIKDDGFKSKARLCGHCNSTLTQPYDRAWEQLSAALRSRAPLRVGQLLKLNKVFKSPSARMLDVHLYFVKHFGCRIAEFGLSIDIVGFSKALLGRTAHPEVFLAIGPSLHPKIGKKIAGWSEIEARVLPDGRCAYAQYFYHLPTLTVLIMYALPGQRRKGLAQAWHPDKQSRLLRIAKLS